MRGLREPDHPIWPILRLAVIFGGLTALLYVNASSFDATELKSVGEFAALLGAFEAGRKKFTR